MALRCWAHVLSRDACIARAIAAALPGAKLHTDVCLLQDGAYTSDGPPAAAPSSEQPSHSQQQSRPSNFRQQYGGAVRLNSSSQSAPGASVSGRGPGYQQAQGSASQGRPPQGPDRHQRFGGQHPDSRQAGPASPSQHSGTVRQPGSFFQASGRVTQSNFPNSGPTANNRFTRPGPDARQQTDWPPYQQQSQPRYQQGGSQYPPNNQNDQRFPGRTILRSSDRSSSPQQGFQRRPQTGPMGRQVPAQANMDPEDVEEQGNPPRRRKAAFGKRITPSSSQSEQPALPPKMRGTASRAQGPPVSLQDDEEAATRMQQDGELDIVPESYLERSQNNVRGVPASWRDELEDEEVWALLTHDIDVHVAQVLRGVTCLWRHTGQYSHILSFHAHSWSLSHCAVVICPLCCSFAHWYLSHVHDKAQLSLLGGTVMQDWHCTEVMRSRCTSFWHACGGQYASHP